MTRKIIWRILASIVLLLSVIFMPWWFSAILGLWAMVYFSLFWEAVLLFFLSDLLYGVNEPKLFGITYISMIVALTILVLVEFIKKKLRFNTNKSSYYDS